MKRSILIIILLIFAPFAVLAHQPRMVYTSGETLVEDPEISQAFYGELKGEPAYYKIEAKAPFHLYVGMLSPDIPGADKDFSADISKDKEPFAYLDGQEHDWDPFYEHFGGDNYYKGPELDRETQAGVYEIKVESPDNEGKYVIAIGKKEAFPFGEAVHAILLMPALKMDFFNKSPYTAFFNLIGLFLLVVLVILSLALSLAAHLIEKLIAKNKRRRSFFKNYRGALRIIKKKFAEQGIGWAVIGSANMLLQGMKVFPNDIDIVARLEDLELIPKLFPANVIVSTINELPKIEKSGTPAWDIKLRINDVETQILGEKDDGEYVSKFISGQIINVDVDGTDIPCLTLDAEQQAYEETKRPEKAQKIREFMQKK